MPEHTPSRDKATIFKLFEASLSNEQRQVLLKHPDLLSPELIGQLYQASLERVSAYHMDSTSSCTDIIVEAGSEATPKKSRKMVNSWMAFRSYYSPLIKDLPQKVRSPMLALLWKNDVDHGLWELLSAAFSYIRDSHTEDGVSIDQFLLVAAQVVPVIPADQYFTRSGWTRVGDALERDEVCPQESPKSTNVSCAGVVRYCFRQGLISRPPTIAHADLRSTKNHRRHPPNISFAAAASSPSVILGPSSVEQAVIKDQNPVNEDIEIDSYDIVQPSAVLELDSGPTNDANTEIGNVFFTALQDAGFSAAMQVGNTSPHGSEFRMMTEDFGAGSYVLDDFWPLPG